MLQSKINIENVCEASPMDRLGFICKDMSDRGESCDYALLLGSDTDEAIMRATYAAELYRAGRIRYIIPSGGVLRVFRGEKMSECDLMSRVLCELGVPESAIIAENSATTTRENMIFGSLVLNRVTGLADVDRMMIITSVWHMRRSLVLARCFLPRKIRSIAGSVPLPCSDDLWIGVDSNLEIIDNEIKYIKKLIDIGIADSNEIN